jgi:AmiR/NasT family two-component response regulator
MSDTHAIDGAALMSADAAALTDLDECHRKIANLETALLTSRRIGIAIGIVMSRYGRTEEQAFDALRQASQRTHRKLRDIADDVVYTGSLPN